MNQEPRGPSLLLESHGQVPSLLGDPGRLGVRCHSTQVDRSRPELDPYQDVQRLQRDGLHGQEIAREYPGRLLAQELSPCGAAPRSGTQAGTTEHGRDRGGRDPHPEPQELATHPHVAPPGVLPAQPEDELANLWVQGGTSWRAVRSGPLPCDELPVPAEEGRRTDQERAPCLTPKHPARGGEERLVRGPVDRPLDLPAEDADLVTQDGVLELRLSRGAVVPPEQAEDAAQLEIEERADHGAAFSQIGLPASRRDRVCVPHGVRRNPRVSRAFRPGSKQGSASPSTLPGSPGPHRTEAAPSEVERRALRLNLELAWEVAADSHEHPNHLLRQLLWRGSWIVVNDVLLRYES